MWDASRQEASCCRSRLRWKRQGMHHLHLKRRRCDCRSNLFRPTRRPCHVDGGGRVGLSSWVGSAAWRSHTRQMIRTNVPMLQPAKDRLHLDGARPCGHRCIRTRPVLLVLFITFAYAKIARHFGPGSSADGCWWRSSRSGCCAFSDCTFAGCDRAIDAAVGTVSARTDRCAALCHDRRGALACASRPGAGVRCAGRMDAEREPGRRSQSESAVGS